MEMPQDAIDKIRTLFYEGNDSYKEIGEKNQVEILCAFLNSKDWFMYAVSELDIPCFLEDIISGELEYNDKDAIKETLKEMLEELFYKKIQNQFERFSVIDALEKMELKDVK